MFLAHVNFSLHFMQNAANANILLKHDSFYDQLCVLTFKNNDMLALLYFQGFVNLNLTMTLMPLL